MSLVLTPKLTLLRDRAHMFQKLRDFFAQEGVLEVDPGALVKCPPNDANIDVIGTDQEEGFLHTSPEYGMKRLLSMGMGDCYFLGHVFRKGELGERHNPEFTMLEWYRIGYSLTEIVQETAHVLSLFFGEKPICTLSYRDAFMHYVGIDYTKATLQELHELTPSPWPKDTCLHYLLTHRIEPNLGRGELTIFMDFPPQEAALACVTEKNGELVAERFEIYHEGIELANGYHELSDSEELSRRFHLINTERQKEGKPAYKLDEKFLSALKTLPDCCGVALGFDRALMLRHNLKSIKPVIPFAWDEL